ncbi:hypothetical protein [Aeribacillus composti]|uniref:hypothetical protein n=1 Tax=Aeribacillus composti TaxID=1868734 RepID=UPI002E23CCAA|nr:hypothetical protein [Aeribacillus composti]
MKLKFPNLDKLTDIEAIHWYTKTVNQLSKEGKLSEFRDELLAWKKQMNERLFESRKKGLDE